MPEPVFQIEQRPSTKPTSAGTRLLDSFVHSAQWTGVIAVGVLLFALVKWPDPTLKIFWKGVVPLLPLTFLVSPILWRSVCPLATLNRIGNRPAGDRQLSGRLLPRIELVGVGLLFVIVPLRIIALNDNGSILAMVVLAIGVVALASGFFFDQKAGFCNSICPVLPVEKLYGQYPLLSLNTSRCNECTLCTRKGCIDLAPAKSLSQSLGPKRSKQRWLTKPYGIFACAFPGFVLGYFLTAGGDPGAPWITYLEISGFALASYVVAATIVRATSVQRTSATIMLAAAAAAFYYWFAVPDLMLLIRLDAPAASGTVRLVVIAFVSFWMYRALILTAARDERRKPLLTRA